MKASSAPAASSTRASPIEIPTGPATVAESECGNGRPSPVQIAPEASQSVVSGIRIVTAP